MSITFDFDDTLLQTRWNPETETADECGPNLVMVQTLRSFIDMGREIHIVTTRIENFEGGHRTSVQSFLEEHKLAVAGVHFTNGESKVETLIKLGATLHFDDDKDELDDLPIGIDGIWVPPHPSWNDTGATQ